MFIFVLEKMWEAPAEYYSHECQWNPQIFIYLTTHDDAE